MNTSASAADALNRGWRKLAQRLSAAVALAVLMVGLAVLAVADAILVRIERQHYENGIVTALRDLDRWVAQQFSPLPSWISVPPLQFWLGPPPATAVSIPAPDFLRGLDLAAAEWIIWHSPEQMSAGNQNTPSETGKTLLGIALLFPDGVWLSAWLPAPPSGAQRLLWPWGTAVVLVVSAVSGLASHWALRQTWRPWMRALGLEVEPSPTRHPERAKTALPTPSSRSMEAIEEEIRQILHQRHALFAAVAHDMRTPLARMRLRLEMLPPDWPERAGWESDLVALERLANDTAEYLRTLRLQPQWQPLAIASWLLEHYAAAATIELGPLPPRMTTDPMLLARVLDNVLSNAQRHAPHCVSRTMDRGCRAMVRTFSR